MPRDFSNSSRSFSEGMSFNHGQTYVSLPDPSFPSSREVSEWETRGVSWTLVYFKAMKEEHWNPVGDATETRL